MGSNGRRAARGSDPGRQAGAARAARPGGLRIALLLFLFGSSLVLPAIAAMVFLLERNWRVHERDVERRLVQVAKDLSDDVDRELELLMATLNGLASSREVTAGDWAAVHERASHMLKPLGIELLYRDLSGQQIMNTRMRWGTPLPHSLQPEIDAAVARTMKPQISDMILGTVAERPLITITAPVLRGETLQGFLHLSILPDRFLATMRRQSLPLEWNTGLSDRKGVVIARLHRHTDFVGKALPAELAMETSEGMVARSINLEGLPSLRAAYRSPLSGWLVSANVPLSVAEAALRQDTLTIIGAGACLLLLCLALALMFGRLITRPIRGLARFAETVEHGDVPPLMNSPVWEANEIAAGLHSVGLRLRDRTQELRGTVERFNAALRGADIVVYALDRERKVTWMSETAGPAGELIGRGGEELLPPDLHEQAAQVEAQALASGQPQEAEVQHGDGDAARHFRLHLEPVRGSDGSVIGLLGVSSEVTALRRAERRNALLVHEIGHRAKNILATVQAIASATLRGSTSLPEFRTRFNERLRALATLQDLTIAGSGSNVPLRALVESQLEPFGTERIAIAGPDVRLTSDAANYLALALHELATNAAKYGALSTATGKVELHWGIKEGARRFQMSWRETGGPGVAPPARSGFGSKVMTALAESAINATATVCYPPDGAHWALDAPLDRVLDEGTPRSSRRSADDHGST